MSYVNINIENTWNLSTHQEYCHAWTLLTFRDQLKLSFHEGVQRPLTNTLKA